MEHRASAKRVCGEVADYSDKYKLSSLFRRMLQLLIEKQPEDPVATLSEWLKSYTPPQVLILGPPGSGKATQVQLLVEHYGLTPISTRSVLRDEINSGSELGAQARGFMERGEQVPDDLIVEAISDRLSRPEIQQNGWIMDGFPRTRVQADALAMKGLIPSAVVMLELTDEQCEHRACGRWIDPETQSTYHLDLMPPPPEIRYRLAQKADDTSDLVKKRIASFRSIQARLAEEDYAPKLHKIDASAGKLKVFQDIKTVLNSSSSG